MFPPTMDQHQAGSMDLLTFQSREVEKSLRRSAGLSVPQSAYDGSRLAIPVPGTGPLRRRSPPPHLVVCSGPAVGPTSSSRRKKRRRAGVPSRSAGEEVVSLSADVRAAASKPASSSATALSPRLAAPPPMPSLLAPARCSEATPDELKQRLRFTASQIKILRTTAFLPHTTLSTRRRGRRKRDASAHATEGLGDASAHATEGLGDASAHASGVPQSFWEVLYSAQSAS
ncbi:uncharacterized protein LOC124878901 [Girardinichthys multiradiatus]|uniref:uncharacterized protein LOC124878901 n=1 Tax=Girardinichthys multiradiatus TaxID=208333 RepID=UPI001FAB9207|nr:uncharacterized protein LOC124878901 [Girardinichthys multiradiatus]